MKFVTLFPETKNVHLLKDIGMIPCMLHRLYGYDAYVAAYGDKDGYPYLADGAAGLQIEYMERRYRSRILNGLRYIRKHAKEIDVLNVYHLNLSSFFWIPMYHLKKKKDGRVYLKLDMSYAGLTTCLKAGPVGFVKRMTIKMADIVSVETTLLQIELKKHFGEKIIYLPNGYALPKKPEQTVYQKEKTILTAGNLGTVEKATDTLLEGFAKSSSRHDWKLKLIGTVAEEFKPYIEQFYQNYPELKERVEFTGPITDKQMLAEEYRKAAVFTLPSRQESFGFVLVEAISCGCYTATADRVPAGHDVSACGKYGTEFVTDDAASLAEVFAALCTKERDWNGQAIEIEQYAKTHFVWDIILKDLRESFERSK